MAAQDCIAAIKAAAGDLTDDEVTEILEILQARAKARQAAGEVASLDEALLDEADRLAADLELAALIEKRNRAINITKRFAIEALVAQVDGKTGDPSLGLSAALVGINAKVPRARASVDARGHALITEYLGGLVAGLRREGVLAIFNSRVLEREIAQELAELSKPASGPNAGRPGISRSREAQKIAQVVDQIRRAAVARENRAGAFIRPLPGYVVRQSHDLHKVRRAGFEAWRDTILPLLDQGRTFQGADPEAFLRGAFDGLQSGRHITSNGADETDLAVAFKGPGNLAKRISQHRVLHFKDSDAWFDYNASFGRGSVADALVHEFERAARNTALMETWGTNPRNLFENLLSKLQDQHRADPKKLDRLNRSALRNQFDEVEGITRVPVDPGTAKVASIVLAVETLSKLGGAALSAFGDLGFKAVEIARGGDNLLTVWRKNLETTFEGMAPGARRETAELLGVGIEGQIGDLASRFMAQDDIPGRVAKVQQLYFKLNLLGPWTDSNKRGLGLMFARDLAMKKGRAWGALDPEQQELFGLYGIGETEWNVARQAARPAADGREYLMPDAIEDLPDDVLDAAVAPQLAQIEERAAERTAQLETAIDRDAEFVGRRKAKFEGALQRARKIVSDFEATRAARLERLDEATKARMDLLKARVEQAEVQADIAAFLSTERVRGKIRDFVEAVEDGKEASRTADRADRQLDRFGRRRGNIGEGLGRRLGRSQRRIVEMDARLRQAERDAGREVKAKKDQQRDRIDRLFKELQDFSDRVDERTTVRRELIGQIERSIAPQQARARRRARDEISTALRAYYVDRAENAVPTPGARERAILKQGTRPGTPLGTALRLVGQFKAFPVTVLTRVFGRLAEADTTGQFFKNMAAGKGDIQGLVHMIVATTVLGYVAQSAKEIAKGRSPRDPSQAATWNAALLQGGGLGIYGDFLFGEFNRFGRSLVETLAGPTLSDAGELAEIVARIRAGEDAGASALRFGVGITPGANLFYTRIALDYLFLFQIQEAINPGFLRRFERRIRRENKQTFIVPPSSAIPRGGGDRILEGVRE